MSSNSSNSEIAKKVVAVVVGGGIAVAILPIWVTLGIGGVYAYAHKDRILKIFK